MTFETLRPLPPDAILGLMAEFQADPASDKTDLTVGVYREEDGSTPVLAAVDAAEQALFGDQTTKSYLPPAGVGGFLNGMRNLVLGEIAERLESRTAVIQTPGGCGALRLGAELFTRAEPGRAVYLSDPTWGNHRPLLAGAGLPIENYPYYDGAGHGLRLEAMLERLDAAPARSLVLLQASCHNPTGADPDASAFSAILDVIEKRSLVPFFDLAYLGLGTSVATDASAMREAASRLPELLIAVSCSKNFGLYRERTGALLVVGAEPSQCQALATNLEQIARGMYSMPPAHGALIVDRILADGQLRARWQSELATMAARLDRLRRDFAAAIGALRPDLDTSWLARQRGMFSLLGLEADAIQALRENQHIYMVGDSRINIAGLNDANIPLVAAAVAPLLH